MANDKVNFEKIDEDAKLPERQHENDAGYDLFSAENVTLEKEDIQTIRTGLKMSLPKGIEAQVRPRSGLSLDGITVMNSPGTIDPGYRGEVKVILANLVEGRIEIEKGDRIAQMVFAEVRHPEFSEGSLEDTERGEGGFGSTGT